MLNRPVRTSIADRAHAFRVEGCEFESGWSDRGEWAFTQAVPWVEDGSGSGRDRAFPEYENRVMKT